MLGSLKPHLAGVGAVLCVAFPAHAGDLKDLLADRLIGTGSLESVGDSTFSVVNDRIAPLTGGMSGYTYEYNENDDAYDRSTSTAGPFHLRPQTLGRGRFLAGISQSFLEFDELDGTDLDDIHSRDLRGFAALGASPDYRFDIDIQQSVSSVHLAYGVTDRLEIGMVVPFIDIEIDASAAPVLQPLPTLLEIPNLRPSSGLEIGTGLTPVPTPSGGLVVVGPTALPTDENGRIDVVAALAGRLSGRRRICRDRPLRDPAGGVSSHNICFLVPITPAQPAVDAPTPTTTTPSAPLPQRFASSLPLRSSASDSYRGIGDTVIRAKWQVVADRLTNAALVASASLPTGDEENLAGVGAFSFMPGVVLSRDLEAAPLGLGLRGFAAYEFRGDDSDQNELEWALGGSIQPFGRTSMSLDVMGSQEIGGERVHVFDLSLGLQLRLGEHWLLGFSYLKPLNDEGLRASNGIATGRLEWVFGD